jgi:ATPase subunit of ABC transporter with duplicated ATPase domains
VLLIEGLSKKTGDELLFTIPELKIEKDDKIAFISNEPLAVTTFFKVIMEELPADTGTVQWGTTITKAYFPNDNSRYFRSDDNLVDWLRQYSKEKDEAYIRGFLGRMLFGGDEALKKCSVLSGGEKVRCMLSRMMLQNANLLIFDEPTNHLDLESITALNNGLNEFKGTILFTSHDHTLTQTLANRIVELTPSGIIDKRMTYDEYLEYRMARA